MEYRFLKCPICGIHYAVDQTVMTYKERAGPNDKDKGWYCPNGHSLIFRESDYDALRRDRDRQKQENARLLERVSEAEAAEAKAVAERKRIEKRVHRGVCPCCSRTFSNVARHMKTKHPNVTPIKAASQ